MAERNRVTPRSEIIATPTRGMFMGNRGCLHDGHTIKRHYNGKLWIICRVEFRGRHHIQWQDGHYTVLFFYDEAVGLAAGHRPCGECRHDANLSFKHAWETVTDEFPDAATMNRRMHDERLDNGHQRTHSSPWSSLPDGTFAHIGDQSVLIQGDKIVPWTPMGYGSPISRPRSGDATVLTPSITVEILRAGYKPVIHPDAIGHSATG